MALSNIWGNNRRVIRQGLVVTYTKKLQYATNIHNITRPYWHYERRRTMEFDYLGLTKSAAEACVAAWSKALLRKAWRQEWIGNAAGDSSENIGYWSNYFAGDIYDDTKYNFVSGGDARLQYDGGKGWVVNVSIDETLPYNHKTFNPGEAMRGAFLAFENNPEMITPAFRYGDPDGMTGADALTDFSLDALEYQFALTSAEWSAVGSTSGIKVNWSDMYGATDPLEYRLEYKRGDYDSWHELGTPLSGGGWTSFYAFEKTGGILVRLSKPLSHSDLINHRTYSNVLEVK